MKTFKYKFSPLQKALIVLGILLSVAGFAVNLVFFIKDDISAAANKLYPILRYSLMALVTVILFVLLTSIILFSAYVIDGKTFKTKFGFIVSKYDVDKITEVVLDRKTQKLTLTFENGEFIVIVVKQDWYESFIEAILAANPKISYSIISLENDGTDKESK